MRKAEDHILIIFGATGDLTRRKLIPALYALEVQCLLPERFAIVGAGRSAWGDEKFREAMSTALNEFSSEKDSSRITGFVSRLHYRSADADDPASFGELVNTLVQLRQEMDIPANLVFYLSTPPELYDKIPHCLAAHRLNEESDGWKRLIVEKPFGYDLASAMALNDSLKRAWTEKQIYRIDHYLGKETVQNVLVTRFTNGIFEPLWNRNYIRHVEITSAESIGVEKRGGYYEGTGALRDMVQNHLLQLVGLVAMEPPASMESDAIRNETVKVLQSIRPYTPDDIILSAIRGQYGTSTIKGEKVHGYREEEGVDPESRTETYAALKFFIDNWRWGGVPFYIRTGKRLPTRVTEAVIHFRRTPHYLFGKYTQEEVHNQLVIRIQPDEGILLKFGMKTPGTGFDVQEVNMDFHYSDLSIERIPEAYERLLLDCMTGDSTLFAREDAVMAAWKFLDPVLNEWKNNPCVPVFGYPAGTWGPERADELIEGAGMTWRYPCKNLSNDGIYCEL